ncbi:hypothetical protein EV191_1014 [Tamaricihabitans halophyticus]|uniref:Uncharacterized protein n=1 Tax=Tamaricihabitans halophyticus TaxID=1262583 RepID=A0A4R2R2N5_9PSEU|nr:hypothetical protein [Tamaricihabitans halophyticus]TCP56064.1 hypothetical protein EV191_1014 [Tamaricihabitans halophyticus]
MPAWLITPAVAALLVLGLLAIRGFARAATPPHPQRVRVVMDEAHGWPPVRKVDLADGDLIEGDSRWLG